MIVGTLLLNIALLSTGSADEAFRVSATLDAASLKTGAQYDVVFNWSVANGYSVSKGGLPAPILQIDVPRSVELVGTVLKGGKALAGNEYLRSPYELLMKDPEVRVSLRIKRRLKSDARINFNVLAFVGSSEGDDAWFVRRRLELPLKAGATSVAGDPTVSKWGKAGILQIGDKAKAFSLSTADGEKVSLKKDLLGEQNVVVMTYRAFW